MRAKRQPIPDASAGFVLPLHINEAVGVVSERLVRCVYRNEIGDWCAELSVDGQTLVEVFDHHPSIGVMRLLREGGTEIADDVLEQGAEGLDVNTRAKRKTNNR